MATSLTLSGPVGYYGGKSQISGPFVGYLDNKNYVLRYSFTTPAGGYITSVTFATKFRHYSGDAGTTFNVRVKITDSSSSHVNAGISTTDYDATMSKSGTSSENKSCTIDNLWLKPETTYYIYLFPGTQYFLYYCYDNSGNDYASLTYNSAVSTHTLSLSAGTGSSITVNRTSSPSGSTGTLSSGATLYYGDVLTVSFTANTGYNLSTYTVNNAQFTSGNAHTVTSNTSVASTAALKTFTLTINSVSNGTIAVNRTSSAGGATGAISNGSTIYYFDKLKITFTPSSGYEFTKTLVNSASFTSGSTHEVTADVTVSGTTQALNSSVGATDAEIGSVSTITIVRNNSSYTHTLSYSFGDLSDIITAKTTSVSYPWTIPDIFYTQIPNDTSGNCIITCETFNGDSSLGTSTCTIKISTSSDLCAPNVSGVVVDINANTVVLTGDNTSFVRYVSTAECTISATANNSASISSLAINGSEVTEEFPIRTITSVETSSFDFKAVDSRGYSTTYTVSPTFVKYVKLTINPIFYRPLPTTGEVALTFNGNYFNGSFGAYSNTLTIRYRYRLASASAYGAWIAVNSSDYDIGTSTYNTPTAISLGMDFDYRQSYVFQIQVYDGANGIILSTITNDITVQPGIPVFDWGENDFNFNVDVRIDNVSIFDIFYPVNSVFMSVNSIMPAPLSSHGTWTAITSEINGINCWTRTA